MTTLPILAALFFAYGAYFAIYRKDFRAKPSPPEPEKDAPRPDEKRLGVRREADGPAIRIDATSRERFPAQRAP